MDVCCDGRGVGVYYDGGGEMLGHRCGVDSPLCLYCMVAFYPVLVRFEKFTTFYLNYVIFFIKVR